MAREPVRLNVYDMYWLNDYASNIGFGIFHSGIEVYGVEYGYGGHPFVFSGIFENQPQDAEELGDNFKFKESIVIGETDFSRQDVRALIKELGGDYKGNSYHLISKNCNHFSASLARLLTGKEIPGWINRLASISGSIPFLEKMLPQEWLTPVALQQSVEGQNRVVHQHQSPLGRRDSVDSAEEAVERATAPPIQRVLNDSRTTMLNGETGDGVVRGGATRGGSARGGANGEEPTLVKFWNQLKSSVGTTELGGEGARGGGVHSAR